MRVGIIGCGSIGTRHAKNLKSYTDSDIVVYDIDYERARKLWSELEPFLSGGMRSRVQYYTNDTFNNFLKHVDAVIICTPHSTHVDYALKAIQAGKHVLIEKPLATSLDRIPELEAALAQQFVHFKVAYNLRFHPAIIQACRHIGSIGKILSARFEYGSYLPNWRPGSDHRTNYAADPTDGGVIMDDIHELDLVCCLIGDQFDRLSCIASNIGDLGITLEDTADISMVVKHDAGYTVPVSVHMDYLQRRPIRKFRIVGTDGTLECDILTPSLLLETPLASTHFKFEEFNTNKMYIAELEQFLQECKFLQERHGQYALSALDGLKHSLGSLKMAVAAKESAEKGITVRNA